MAINDNLLEYFGVLYADTKQGRPDPKNYSKIKSAFNYQAQKGLFDRDWRSFIGTPSDTIIDLTSIPQAENVYGEMIAILEKSLRSIQKFSGTVNLNDQQQIVDGLKKSNAVIGEINDFVNALGVLNGMAWDTPALPKVYKQRDWSNLKSRFVNKKGEFYPYIQRFLNDPSPDSAANVIHAFRGSKFAASFGQSMEELIPTFLMSTPAVREEIEKQFGIIIKKTGVLSGKTGPIPGTIRAQIIDISFDGDEMKYQFGKAGSPLRDAFIEVTPTSTGMNISFDLAKNNTTGISMKRRNLNRSSKQDLANLTLNKFLPTFLELKKLSFYLYRAMAEQGSGDQNGVGYFLARRNLDQILRGTAAIGDSDLDLTDIMIFNGRISSVKTFLSKGEPSVKVSLKTGRKGKRWIPAENAPKFLDEMHQSHLIFFIDLQKSINLFN